MGVELGQFRRRLVELLLGPTADRQVRAEGGEVAGDPEIDAAAAARDENGLSLEQIFGQIVIDDHGLLPGGRMRVKSVRSPVGAWRRRPTTPPLLRGCPDAP